MTSSPVASEPEAQYTDSHKIYLKINALKPLQDKG